MLFETVIMLLSRYHSHTAMTSIEFRDRGGGNKQRYVLLFVIGTTAALAASFVNLLLRFSYISVFFCLEHKYI